MKVKLFFRGNQEIGMIKKNINLNVMLSPDREMEENFPKEVNVYTNASLGGSNMEKGRQNKISYKEKLMAEATKEWDKPKTTKKRRVLEIPTRGRSTPTWRTNNLVHVQLSWCQRRSMKDIVNHGGIH